MPKLAANLSLMFTEVNFLDRFAAAAAAGFDGVEFLFPYDFSTGRNRRAAQAVWSIPGSVQLAAGRLGER
jgi:hydroxypyruvate isomerase